MTDELETNAHAGAAVMTDELETNAHAGAALHMQVPPL
jgi:hypothetical protein